MKKITLIITASALILILALGFIVSEAVSVYTEYRNESDSQIPEQLLALYERNPEAEDFVMSYPAEGKKGHHIDLDNCLQSDSVPLLMQWDKRWGYMEYSGDFAALTACGPVCLSMVAIHLTKDSSMTPAYIMDFATSYNYCEIGHGTKWTLMKEGAEQLGLSSKELPLVESVIDNNLRQGNPVICIMGPGDFTTKGHFIVLTEYCDGKYAVNDPNSYENSSRLWSYDEISGQIRNLWAISKAT